MSNYSQTSKFKCSPAISFSKSRKISLNKENIPGPGTYDIKSNQQLAKKTVFSKAKNQGSNNKNNGLGPGQYDIKSMKNKNNILFDKSKRQLQHKQNQNDNIGPGMYDIGIKDIQLKQKQQNYVFGKAELKDKNKNDLGPGQYFDEKNYKKINQAKCFTVMKGSLRFSNQKKQNDSIIGPGAYQEKVQTFSKKGGVIGKSQSVNQHRYGIDLGPGQYNNFKTPNKLQNNTKFGKQKRFNEKQNVQNLPGPGQYCSNDMDKQIFKNLKGFIFDKNKNRNNSNQLQLGPGQYYQEKHIQARGGKFNKSIKQSLKRNQLEQIGPGAYNTQKDLFQNNGFSFGRSKFKSNLNQTQLGPGQYDVNQINKFKFPLGKAKRSKTLTDQIPGPGQYKDQTQVWSKKGGFMSKKETIQQKHRKIDNIDYYNLPDTIPNVRHYNYPSLDKRKIKPNTIKQFL